MSGVMNRSLNGASAPAKIKDSGDCGFRLRSPGYMSYAVRVLSDKVLSAIETYLFNSKFIGDLIASIAVTLVSHKRLNISDCISKIVTINLGTDKSSINKPSA